MYETIRSRLEIKDDQKNLIDIIDTKREFSRILDPLVDKRIMLVYDPILSDSGEITGGKFNGGLFRKIGFYNCKEASNGFEGHIWFSSKGHASGLDRLYDVAIIDESDRENLGNLTNNDLKIFKFEAHAGSDEEKSHVIHRDAFSAYNALLERDQIRSHEQILKEVIKIAPGFSIYEHTNHRE